MNKIIEIIKNRSDIGAGTRGSDLGIDALEIAAINKGSDFFIRYSHKDLRTRNNTVYNPLQNPFAKHITQIYKQCKEVLETVDSTLSKNMFPLVISGDHSSAMGTIAGIKKSLPNQTLGVIWIDAHADIHSPYSTPSGNMHGMPLAAAMQLDNLDYAKNNVNEETKLFWDKLKNIGGDYRKISPQHLIYFGVRDVEKEEIAVIKDLNIKNYTVKECRDLGITEAVRQALTLLTECDVIYISFDVDSMDSDLISSGTGTPVPEGFEVHEIKQMLKEMFKSEKIACLEIVEINPLLDNKGNRMAEVTFDILDNLIKEIT